MRADSYLSALFPEEIKRRPLSKSRFDFERSLKKALSAGCKGIIFPEDFLDHKEISLFVQKAKKEGLIPVFQISAARFRAKQSQLAQNQESKSAKAGAPYPVINILFEDPQSIPFAAIKNSGFSRFLFTCAVTKRNRKTDMKKILPAEILKNMEFYFPYKKRLSDPFLTPRQVYQFAKKQKNALRLCPSDIYDSRIAFDMDLEPLALPFATNQISAPGQGAAQGQTNAQTQSENRRRELDFSIIIPSYNNKQQLLNSLEALAKQDYPSRKFEIIVVDDGSSDETLRAVQGLLGRQKDKNWTIFYFPRVFPRVSGDARFRAGIARNLGAKYAKGKILAFLDADILTPPFYLQTLRKEHEKADVILLKRYHLKPSAPIESLLKDSGFDHEKLKPYWQIEEKSYWGLFYEKGFQNAKAPWKYICTYGLSLSKKDFIEAGRFGRSFLYYGFEDIDLGYRLYKSGKSFLLSDLKVYHQPPDRNRHEHRNSFLSRHKTLSRTAKIFFYRRLDPMIYRELKIYMRQERGLSYFFPKRKPNLLKKH